MFSQRKPILIALAVCLIILLILIAFLIFSGIGCKKAEPEKIELVFWNLWDDSDAFSELIAAYQEEHSNITIKYYKKTYQEYENQLINALAAGRGPDILTIHNTWLPKHQDKIVPAPRDLISTRDYKQIFVDVAEADFITGDRIYALPFSIDTLVLYYNKDLLQTAGMPEPPRTWTEFKDVAEELTRLDQTGNIIRAGAVVGTAKNINRSTDILGLLMLQGGTPMINEDKTEATFNRTLRVGEERYSPGEIALQFYTDFANPRKRVYTWNSQMNYSIDAFAHAKAAMMFGYSYHRDLIEAIAPALNFAVAPVPQIEGTEIDINYANYWGQTVSVNSEHPEEAWDFIHFISQKNNLARYLTKTAKPTSRRDLVVWQKNDSELGVFATQALTAKTWYQVDNLAIETILADMIESVVKGQATIKEAISRAASQVTVLMR